MKYTIRYRGSAEHIASAHWAIWRPGMYDDPFRALKSFATTDTFADAVRKVNDDTVKAMLEFSDYTGQNNVDLVEAAWWWAAHERNVWKRPFQ